MSQYKLGASPNSSKQKNFLEFSQTISTVLLFVIVLDCTLFGGGVLIHIGEFGFRMMCYVLFFISTLPLVLKKWRELTRNKYFLAFLLLGIWIGIETVFGLLRGNESRIILAELIGYASFGILPGVFCVLQGKKIVVTLAKYITLACIFYSFVILFFLFFYQLGGADFIGRAGYALAREYDLIFLGPITDKFIRISSGAQLYQPFACACAIYYAVFSGNNRKWIVCACAVGLMLYSLLVSLTRSVYLATFVAAFSFVAIGLFFLDKGQRRKMFRTTCSGVVAFFAISLAITLLLNTDYFRFGLQRALITFDNETETLSQETSDMPQETSDTPQETSDTPGKTLVPSETDRALLETDYYITHVTVESDKFRGDSIKSLLHEIRARPIFGSGVGATIGWRDSTEYFWLNVIHKLGFIGLILYIAPFVLALAFLLGRQGKTLLASDRYLLVTWTVGFLSICAFCLGNPTLNGTNGIVFYCCTIGAFNVFDPHTIISLCFGKRNKNKEQENE